MFSVCQTKFSSRSRGWVELPSDTECKSRVKLRLDHSLKNKGDSRRLSGGDKDAINLHDKEGMMGLFHDNVVIQVQDVPLSLNMSSVTGLMDLIEDEVIPKPLPVEV